MLFFKYNKGLNLINCGQFQSGGHGLNNLIIFHSAIFKSLLKLNYFRILLIPCITILISTELGFHESTPELGQLLIFNPNFIKFDPQCIKYDPWIKIGPHLIKFCPSMNLFSILFQKKH